MPGVWNKQEDRINGWTAAGVMVLVGVVSVAIIFIIGGFTLGLRTMTAGLVGRAESHIEIQSKQTRIPAYNHFFNLCASVQQAEDRIDVLEAELPLIEGTSARNRAIKNISANYAVRQEGIRQYNADSAKDWTIGQFKSSKLAWDLDPTPYDGGNKTTCVYSE